MKKNKNENNLEMGNSQSLSSQSLSQNCCIRNSDEPEPVRGLHGADTEKKDYLSTLCTPQATGLGSVTAASGESSVPRPRRLDQIFPEPAASQAFFSSLKHASAVIAEHDPATYEQNTDVFAVLISSLHEAVDDDNLTGVKEVINAAERRSMNINWINVPDPDGNSCAHKAAWRGNLNILWVLLQHGADPRAMNKSSKTPTEFSSFRRNFECRHLLQKFEQTSPQPPKSNQRMPKPRPAYGLRSVFAVNDAYKVTISTSDADATVESSAEIRKVSRKACVLHSRKVADTATTDCRTRYED